MDQTSVGFLVALEYHPHHSYHHELPVHKRKHEKLS